MRRTEVLQGLRRMKFEDVYGRWQERRLSQEEAAEILGMSERTFRRWRDRYDAQGLEGLLDRRLGKAVGQAGAGRPGGAGARAVSQPLSRLHRPALLRQAAPAPRLCSELHLDQAAPAAGRADRAGTAALGASQEAAAATVARDDAAPGWLIAPLAAGARSGDRPDRDPGRRHLRDLLGVPG